MSKYRKLSKSSSQRKALLRNQVSELIRHGKIITTEARAKEIRKFVEPLIALAAKEKDNFELVKVTAKVPRKDTIYDEVEKEIKKDLPSRLNARRKIAAFLYNYKELPKDSKRKKDIKKVDITSKLLNEVAPKYADLNGGYTRIVKIGVRKGDGAMEVLIELV